MVDNCRSAADAKKRNANRYIYGLLSIEAYV
jgi:hypothetical protein